MDFDANLVRVRQMQPQFTRVVIPSHQKIQAQVRGTRGDVPGSLEEYFVGYGDSLSRQVEGEWDCFVKISREREGLES